MWRQGSNTPHLLKHCRECKCSSPYTHSRSVKTTLIPLQKLAENSDSLGNEERRNKTVIRIFAYHQRKRFTSCKIWLSRFIPFSSKTIFVNILFSRISVSSALWMLDLFVRHIYVGKFPVWAGQATLKLLGILKEWCDKFYGFRSTKSWYRFCKYKISKAIQAFETISASSYLEKAKLYAAYTTCFGTKRDPYFSRLTVVSGSFF
jgi:hypothetical protein